MNPKYSQTYYQWQSRLLSRYSHEKIRQTTMRFRKKGLSLSDAKLAAEEFLDALRIKKEVKKIDPKYEVTSREAAGMIAVLEGFNEQWFSKHRGALNLVPIPEPFFVETYIQFRFVKKNPIPKSPAEKLALAKFVIKRWKRVLDKEKIDFENVVKHMPDLAEENYSMPLGMGVVKSVRRHPWLWAGILHARRMYEMYRTTRSRTQLPLPLQHKILNVFIDDIYSNYQEFRDFCQAKVARSRGKITGEEFDQLEKEYHFSQRLNQTKAQHPDSITIPLREALVGKEIAEHIARNVSRYAHPKYSLVLNSDEKSSSVSFGETNRPRKKPATIEFDNELVNWLRNPANHRFIYRLVSPSYR